MTNNQCCPEFDPKLWQDKTHHWDQKPFITTSIPVFFHMPLPWLIGKAIGKLWQQATEAKVNYDGKDFLLLIDDPTPFKSVFYLAVKKPIKNAENFSLTGTFVSRVYDGSYNAIPKFIKDMNDYLADKKVSNQDFYIHYAYCPKCSAKYGHNYVILFAKVK